MAQTQVQTRQITMTQALNEAMREEMRRDARVFIMGEDIQKGRQPFCTHSRATWKTPVDGGGCSLRANLCGHFDAHHMLLKLLRGP